MRQGKQCQAFDRNSQHGYRRQLMAREVFNPHDALFRSVFATDQTEAAGLLRAYLPEPLARSLNWSSLTFDDSSYVSAALRATESDLLYAVRDGRLLLEQVVSLLRELPAVGGIDHLLPYVVYVQATQDEETWWRFSAALRRDVARGGGEVIDYAERLIERGKTQGREEGRLEGRVGTIEDLLRAGVGWPMIESATGIDRDAFQALKQGIDGAANGTE